MRIQAIARPLGLLLPDRCPNTRGPGAAPQPLRLPPAALWGSPLLTQPVLRQWC